MKKLLKGTAYAILIVTVILLAGYAYLKWGLAPTLPKPTSMASLQLSRQKVAENHYRIGNNWLRKTETGLWEEYLEGEPFERGVISGKLAKELLYTQEVAFVDQIHRLVPNDNHLSFLGLFTRFFNRHLEENVTEENKLEIYGESFSAPKQFEFISPAYDRMLNYHAAHDIGHALQSLALVGCSSFAVWGSHSADSTMLIGRNLDFYLGDDFARDKIVYFCNPSQGHKFVIITWAGFVGCVSGMNTEGLTVTINAAKSDVPNGATTPISLLAREILQYAGNIEEAYAIAKKRQTFVCETIMIGSAADGKTALIEKAITKTALFGTDTNYILCTNHYQSDTFKNDKNNIENIATSASMYRYNRLQQLVARYPKMNYTDVAAVLRDQQGIDDTDIGIGNEKALNQLISHHGIIFQPQKLKFWVSANPYQLGAFICYDLNKVFEKAPQIKAGEQLHEAEFTVVADTFLQTNKWKGFLRWRQLKQQLKDALHTEEAISGIAELEAEMLSANPNFWETHYWLGEYYRANGNAVKARSYFEAALKKEINDRHEADAIRQVLKEMEKETTGK